MVSVWPNIIVKKRVYISQLMIMVTPWPQSWSNDQLQLQLRPIQSAVKLITTDTINIQKQKPSQSLIESQKPYCRHSNLPNYIGIHRLHPMFSWFEDDEIDKIGQKSPLTRQSLQKSYLSIDFFTQSSLYRRPGEPCFSQPVFGLVVTPPVHLNE